MGSAFKFEMSRNFERDLTDMLQGSIAAIASDYQRMFDRLAGTYKGRPIAEIKPALQREWARIGGSISDPELSEYAAHISEGTPIEMRVA